MSRTRARRPRSSGAPLLPCEAARLRPEIVLQEAPAPQRLAPWAVALTADVLADAAPTTAPPRTWPPDGSSCCTTPPATRPGTASFRVVTFARAAVEPDVAGDPMLPSVGWSWLIEALEGRGAPYASPERHRHPGRVGVVRLAERPTADAPRSRSAPPGPRSTPTSRPHLEAWGELLATTAGLPPLAPWVVALPRVRRAR